MIDNPENKAVLAKTVTLEVTPKQAEEINLAKDLGKISLSLRSMAKLKNVPVPDAAATAPQTLDDVLREELPGGSADGSENGVTRDTDVSKILTRSPGSARVRVLRGTAQAEDLMFGPGGTTTNPNGTPNGAPVVR
jgi:Flp pilus assembly protein CpaB